MRLLLVHLVLVEPVVYVSASRCSHSHELIGVRPFYSKNILFMHLLGLIGPTNKVLRESLLVSQEMENLLEVLGAVQRDLSHVSQ